MSQITRNIRQALRPYDIRIDPSAKLSGRVFFNGPCAILEWVQFTNSAMGAYSYIAGYCNFNSVKMGRYCSIAACTTSHVAKHNFSGALTSPLFSNSLALADLGYTPATMQLPSSVAPQRNVAVEVGHDVWMGTNVILAEDVTIGTGAVLGANAVITKDVPPYAIMIGQDRLLRYRFKDEVISDLLASEWWQYDLPAMAKAGVELPYTEPERLLQFLKDLDPAQLIQLKEQWVEVEVHAPDATVAFTEQQVESGAVHEFFAGLRA